MNLEQKLGFDKVRTMVSVKCATDYARTRVEEEEFISDPDDILMRLCLTDEMRLICLFEDSFPVSGYIDTKPFLTPLSAEYSWIELQSLAKLRTSQDTLRGVLTFFRGCKDDLYPNLRAIASSVNYFPEVSRRINAILDRNNEVKDSASPELQQIRKSLKEKSASISKRIATILKQAQMDGLVEEGVSVAVRDGRTLIPVSAANKKRLPGLVYDESATGKTAFIEPFEVVELENQVRELQFEEQREIVRILTEFTDFLRPYIPELCAASDFLGEMDFIRAKARVAVDMIAGLPVLSTDGGMTFRKARHPLLEATLRRERKEIVPLTMSLTKEKHILLISGPNAGGKSVCLKTVGLLQYMFQWGMLIPTSEISELLVFDEIFIDIGDDQSLENDLSTYSSHLANLRDILDRSTKNSLVLIDEFGSGTEPAAGGAIAEAVLSELDRRGTYGVITTHYTNLKLYASGSTGVINGAMLFDAAAIQPMFKLEQGLPGNSFAFELARKMGLPESLVHDAEERAGGEYVNMERNLRRISRSRKQLDEKLAHIKVTDRTLDSLTEKYQKELSEVKALKKEILDKARSEAQEILDEANRQVEKTIREIREAQAEKEKTREARKGLDEFKARIKAEEQSEEDRRIEAKMAQIAARKAREAERKIRRGELQAAAQAAGKKTTPKDESPLRVGDKVRVKNSDLVGEVTRISAKDVYVSIGSIINRTKASKLEKISNQQYKEQTRPVRSTSRYDASGLSERRLKFSPSIDIRGERLSDAMDIVVKFIDDAMMLGMGQVKILHGKGTGVLREEIRKYLRTVPGVASARDEALEMGGAGITVVEFDI